MTTYAEHMQYFPLAGSYTAASWYGALDALDLGRERDKWAEAYLRLVDEGNERAVEDASDAAEHVRAEAIGDTRRSGLWARVKGTILGKRRARKWYARASREARRRMKRELDWHRRAELQVGDFGQGSRP